MKANNLDRLNDILFEQLDRMKTDEEVREQLAAMTAEYEGWKTWAEKNGNNDTWHHSDGATSALHIFYKWYFDLPPYDKKGGSRR